MLWRLICALLTLPGLLAATASATTITIAPIKDNTLIQQTGAGSQLSNGLGDTSSAGPRQDGSGPTSTTTSISIRRGLIEFNIAGSVPSGATITSVSLNLRDVMGLNGDPTVELHRVLQDWGESDSFQNGGMGATPQNGDATWLYTFYNATTPSLSPPWTTPGGNFSSTVSASAVVFDDLGGGQTFTWSSASNSQMLTDVQGWFSNPSSNFGWLLSGDESVGQTAKRFNSRESTASPNVPPALSITYTTPEPSSCALAACAAIVVAFWRDRGLRRK